LLRLLLLGLQASTSALHAATLNIANGDVGAFKNAITNREHQWSGRRHQFGERWLLSGAYARHYTAIVRGVSNASGLALVEVHGLN
jgi:hypothetical protein